MTTAFCRERVKRPDWQSAACELILHDCNAEILRVKWSIVRFLKPHLSPSSLKPPLFCAPPAIYPTVIFLTFIKVRSLSLPPRVCLHSPFGLCLWHTLTHTWPVMRRMYDSWVVCILRSTRGWKQLSLLPLPLPLPPHLQGGMNNGSGVKGEWRHDANEHRWLPLGWEIIFLSACAY